MKKHIFALTILLMFLAGIVFVFNVKPVEAKSYG
jgi:cbb3-type cytochrome oxidase subunit 3